VECGGLASAMMEYDCYPMIEVEIRLLVAVYFVGRLERPHLQMHTASQRRKVVEGASLREHRFFGASTIRVISETTFRTRVCIGSNLSIA
jgi:hypothetical protein